MALALKPWDDPLRSLDWRWQLAQQRAPLPRRSRRTTADTPATGDEWLAPARDYLKGRRRIPQSSGIVGAIALRDEGQVVLRSKVEALLLTRMSYADIAARYGISEYTVEAYHALFFDVRDRLEDCLWINAQVLGRDADGNCHDFADGAIWRRVGYDEGVVMLDVYMAVMLDQELPQTFVAQLKSNRNRRVKYYRDRIKLTIARQRATTHKAHASLDRNEADLRKRRVKIFGDESPAECAVRVMKELLRPSLKAFKAAMSGADREKGTT